MSSNGDLVTYVPGDLESSARETLERLLSASHARHPEGNPEGHPSAHLEKHPAGHPSPHPSRHVRLIFGDEPPGQYEVLVSGVPDRALVEHATLRHLVIPWVGLPGRTRTLLLEFPHVVVHNIHHNAAPTAEMALALLLAAATRLVPSDRDLRRGDWTPRYDESARSTLLDGKRTLILGYGAVGRRLAASCGALHMDVTVMSRRGANRPHAAAPEAAPVIHRSAAPEAPSIQRDAAPEAAPSIHRSAESITEPRHLAFTRGVLLEALEQTDALVIALPLTPETRNLLDAEALSHLPSHAVLVNVARGPIIEEEALYHALSSGQLGAAGIDVWWTYPENDTKIDATYPSRFPFHELDNVVMSPHRAGHSDQTGAARGRELHRLLTEIALTGTSSQRVDVERGY